MWNLSQGPCARVSRAVSSQKRQSGATLIVVYAGDSLIYIRLSLWLQISEKWYDKGMLGKVLALSTLAAFVLLSAIMQSTSPATVHPLGILVVFVLIYLLAVGVLTFFIYFFAGIVGRAGRKQSVLSLRHAYFYASVVALAPVMLVGMKSIGRGSLYEIVLVIVFEIVACFYLSKQQ